jgi:hypothetical protein
VIVSCEYTHAGDSPSPSYLLRPPRGCADPARGRRGEGETAMSSTTHWVLAGLATVALIWELVALLDKDIPVFTRVVRGFPRWLTFLCGFLAGHLWW